ncbi:hydrogenase maturation nickel metallochaperone HypA [Lachnoclostridium sp. Marseille-P6806]|uniref:hydrogenase maturation nickel metallochaperone HypA n=1 Tax=Lachnoclostridium sp. Marseille-P6806 TaxID=2364793 RepID=UPI00102F867D|nr:hydrogenase maturation nickel metallochaperone HypA [Lachnoclostridium sp. Marseille-P6806]
MHEMGIVVNLAKTVSELAEENRIIRVGSVTLSVGEVSGIMTDMFVDCWNYFKGRYPVLADSELCLEAIPAVTYCSSCGRRYETVQYGRECPYCHSGETWLETGNECVIKQIEAETEEGRSEEHQVEDGN